jgi:hypothetical protein
LEKCEVHPLRNMRDPSRSLVRIIIGGVHEDLTIGEARAFVRAFKDSIAEASEPLPAKPSTDAAGA